MKKQIIAVLFLVVLSVGTTSAMSMSSCTPEQAADIMVQPVKDTVTGYHDALVNGDITEDEYISLMYFQVYVIKVKVMLLDILLATEMCANEFRAALCDIMPWNIR